MFNRWMCNVCYISVQERNINRHLNNDTHKILSNDLTNLKITYSNESINLIKQERDQRKNNPEIHENYVKQEQVRSKIYRNTSDNYNETEQKQKLLQLQLNKNKLVHCIFCNQDFKQSAISKHRKTNKRLQNFNKEIPHN